MERVTKTVVPHLCKPSKDKEGNDVAPRYSGSFTFNVPNYDERMNILIVMEEANGPEGTSAKANQYRQYQAVARLLPKFVTAIDFTRVDDDYKFASMESMQADTDMGGMITYMVQALIEANIVGKTS